VTRTLTSALRAGRQAAAAVCGSMIDVRGTPSVVAVAISDGPDATATAAMLDTLKQRGATATFFFRVEAAEAERDVVAQARAAGHEIGLRVSTRRDLRPESVLALAGAMRAQRRRLVECSGESVTRQIAVYETGLGRFCAAARLAGLPVVEPGAIAWDWLDLDEPTAVDRAARALRAGGIVEVHDGFAPLADRPVPQLDHRAVLGGVLDEIAARGWSAVSIAQLQEGRTPRRRPWYE
jgi:peptidoglycan/xylan/chitin deacetylase (PgdA/CDA1 family)